MHNRSVNSFVPITYVITHTYRPILDGKMTMTSLKFVLYKKGAKISWFLSDFVPPHRASIFRHKISKYSCNHESLAPFLNEL